MCAEPPVDDDDDDVDNFALNTEWLVCCRKFLQQLTLEICCCNVAIHSSIKNKPFP